MTSRTGRWARLAILLLTAGLAGTAESRADGVTNDLPVVFVQAVQNALKSGLQPGLFTVLRTGDTGQSLVVNYRLSGTATNGLAYERLSGAVTIPAGQSSAPLVVTPLNDGVEDASDTVTVTLVTRTQPFTLAVLPDSQIYTREMYGATSEIFTAQTRWIAAHKDDLNIAFVLHEGDITDANTAREWGNAKTSLSLLSGVVPYALTLGNHDGLSTRQNNTTFFNQFFPASQFQALPTFGGVFESNRMDNSYHLFSAGGLDWLALSLEYGPRNEVLAWANQVASNYPARQVILLTHTHVYSDNTLHGTTNSQSWLPTDYGRANNGVQVWDKFLRRHANTRFAFNGHVLNSGTGRLVGLGDHGNRVYQMLANYQMNQLGGAGYLRLVQFFPDQDKMTVKTYSPYLDTSLTDTNNQFEYANLGVFTNASPGYAVDQAGTSANLVISNNNVDASAPAIAGFSYRETPPVFAVTFTEPVDPESAKTLAHYAINNGVQISDASLSADGKTVWLAATSALMTHGLYTLTVNHVKDRARAANEITTPIAIPFTYEPLLLADTFSDDQLPGWTVVDEGSYYRPSFWLERTGRLMQLNNTYSSAPTGLDHRKGTFLYWNDPKALGWSDYSLSASFSTLTPGGIGVMFRYQNPSNYYKVDFDSQFNFRKLFKMVGGVETTLAVESNVTSTAYNALRIDLTNNAITVTLNNAVLFGGLVSDASLRSGTVAFYSWRCMGALFDDLKVTPLRRFPRVSFQTPASGSAIVLPDPVPITLDVYDPDQAIGSMTLVCGSTVLATLTNAPYQFNWTNATPGTYTLTAQAADGAGPIASSSPIVVEVKPRPPPPHLLSQATSQAASQGANIVFRAQAAGTRPLSYQWFLNGAPLAGATCSFLLINGAQAPNAGLYSVQVSNQWGVVVSEPATLTVDPSPQPASDLAGPPSLAFSGLEIMDPGIPLLSLQVTNLGAVAVEWSSNLVSWAPLMTLTNRNGVVYVADPAGTNARVRFYRAITPP